MQTTEIVNEIRRAMKNVDTTQWIKMTAIAEHTDLTPEQWKRGMAIIIHSAPEWEVKPECNQKVLTRLDRMYRVRAGGQDNDLIKWVP